MAVASGSSDRRDRPATRSGALRPRQAAYALTQGLRVGWYWGQKLAASARSDPGPPRTRDARRLPGRARLLGDLRRLLARDWANIAAGSYDMPAGLLPNPAAALRRMRRFFSDLPQVEARRHAGDAGAVARQPHTAGYPRYYLQNFHFQSDGWLSAESAALYDHQVEVLFGGAADAMRRQELVPIGREVARLGVRQTGLLDLGCGTGRFLREIKANYPRMTVTALDLSPFYLDAARRLLAPWSRCGFVTAPAESIPLAPASVDIVTATYLFHELPPHQRRRTAGEIARVLRPGGLFVLLDTLQLGDEPDYDALLRMFPRRFHEPYYAGYVRSDLARLFTGTGLAIEESTLAYLSKLTTFRKAHA